MKGQECARGGQVSARLTGRRSVRVSSRLVRCCIAVASRAAQRHRAAGARTRLNIVGTDGPYTSASIRPTRSGRAAPTLLASPASAAARFAATVDLPTPPLQLLTPMSAPTCLSDSGALCPMKERGLRRLVRITGGPAAHGREETVSAASARSSSRCGHAPLKNSKLNDTSPPAEIESCCTSTSDASSTRPS